MAMCESCNKGGFTPVEMFVHGEHFVGPCCAKPGMRQVFPLPGSMPATIHVLPNQEDVEYGIEVSNKVGVRAFANYHGLAVSFERSPAQIREWAEKNGFAEHRKLG